MKTFIIAEAGSCHDGSLEKAKRLIDLAYNTGADACKFQYCSDPIKLAAKRGMSPNLYPWSIQREWLDYLSGYCAGRIELMCSTFLTEDIEVVAPYVNRFKVSAFEAEDDKFVFAHIPYGKPILVSGHNSCPNVNLTALHCVSEYPCPDNKIHLSEILNFDDDYDSIGLSDHTRNPLSGAIAVALGAQYVETHFRLADTSPSCPDYVVARRPNELALYISNIRQAEVLLA